MTMLRVGDMPETFVYNTYAGQKYYMDKTRFTNKVTVLSFLDINSSWAWLYNMKRLRAYFPVTSVGIVAVIFDNLGSVDSFSINTKFPDPYITQAELMTPYMPVCLEEYDFSVSNSSKYLTGFNNVEDPSFHSNAGVSFWSYIISEGYYITDKWNFNCTAVSNQDPISFRRFMAGDISFDSTNFDITEAYVKERVTRLLAAPEVKSIDPFPSVISGLSTLKIMLSKPVGSIISSPVTNEILDTSNITNTFNYTFSGGATIAPGSIGFSSVKSIRYENSDIPTSDPDGTGKIENVITLNVDARLTDIHDDKSLIITLNNIEDTMGNPLLGNVIKYTADVTPPRVTGVKLNPR